MNDIDHHLLREILWRLECIERLLYRPKFRMDIGQIYYDSCNKIISYGENIMSIAQGGTGVFLGTVTASDGSAVTTSNWTWTASDPSVTIVNDPSDTTGATVDVTVPASDTSTTFNLTATASATSTTETTPQTVTATVPVTVTTTTPVTFTLSISQTK